MSVLKVIAAIFLLAIVLPFVLKLVLGLLGLVVGTLALAIKLSILGGLLYLAYLAGKALLRGLA